MTSHDYESFLQQAAAEDSMGINISCSNPATLREILTKLRDQLGKYEGLEFYLHPKDPEVLVIVNPENCPGPLDNLDFEILEDDDGS